ncbi:MAG TPA: hypothetical protein VGK78_03875 [Nocardioides sp.]|uniref:hypothetical protein n=1 Tax=Nocardioides sp. TaxID=35761 RepID=UPI002F404310
MSMPRAISSLRTRRMLTWFVPVVGLSLYLILVPPVPDFAAQATRAEIFAKLGNVSWWPGWYGGLELPTYSVIAPGVMATIGVATTGALASAICMWVAHLLFRESARPRAASVVFAASVLLNLFGGRITFLVGLAAAMLAVLALVRRHPWLAGAATVVSVLGSPLAGLFTGIVAAAVLVADRSRRREALVTGAATAGSLGTLALLFHNPGVMGSPPEQMFLALVGLALVVVACREPTIRVGAVIVALGLVACLIVPNSVGLNLTRIVWLSAAPLIVGFGRRPDRHVVALTALALVFPAVDVSWQLAEADSPSASQSYYTPLLTQLRSRMNTDATLGQRVEVVEPATKGAARYVGESMPVARGWERQADVTDNPIFYKDGALDATSYRQWLDQLAVAYVAVPNAKLDFASVDEAKLIAGGLPYLREVWHNNDWKLYQVLGSAPLARHAQVLSVDGNQLRLWVSHRTLVPIQVRWSQHLAVLDGSRPVAEGVRAHGCLSQNGQWTLLHARRAGTYVLTSDFDVLPDGPKRGGVCRTPGS